LIIDKTLVEVSDINIGKMKKINGNSRRQQENPVPRFGHPPAFSDDQEARILSKSISRPSLSVLRKKGELFDEIEEVSGNVSVSDTTSK
jgi:hypothetical protein